MNISMNLIKKLGSNLREFDNFRSEPFILFEKSNFLNSQLISNKPPTLLSKNYVLYRKN